MSDLLETKIVGFSHVKAQLVKDLSSNNSNEINI